MINNTIGAGKLFNRESGRTFITAIDHGMVTGVQPGNKRILSVVEKLVSCEPEGILISPGVLRCTGNLFAFHGAPSPIIRTDFLLVGERVEGLGEHYRVLCGPDEAASLGAEAIIMFLALGVKNGSMIADNARAVAEAAHRAHRIGMPLLVEVVLWGARLAETRDPQLLSWGCRMAAELGADIVKTEYTGEPETMAEVIEGCPVPVLILGGAKTESEATLLETTREAVNVGARGVVYGRNIWQAEEPLRISASIREVLHGACGKK